MEKKMTTIPFDIEIAKKIQSGEMKGLIKTKQGDPVRVICFDKIASDSNFQLVALVNSQAREDVYFYNEDGVNIDSNYGNGIDLVLQVTDYTLFKKGDVICGEIDNGEGNYCKWMAIIKSMDPTIDEVLFIGCYAIWNYDSYYNFGRLYFDDYFDNYDSIRLATDEEKEKFANRIKGAGLNDVKAHTRKAILSVFPNLSDNRPVTERIKTFEDACDELGEEHPFVLAYQNTNLRDPEVAEDNHDILAYLKLRIICAALNEGWHPKFSKCEYRWYSWFYLFADDELNKKSDESDAVYTVLSTDKYICDPAGFVFARSYSSPSDSFTNFGSRLCLKSESLAIYCGKQFIDIWADFYLIRK